MHITRQHITQHLTSSFLHIPQTSFFSTAETTRVVFFSVSLLLTEGVSTILRSVPFGHPNSAYSNEDERSKSYTTHDLHCTSVPLRLMDQMFIAFRYRSEELSCLAESKASAMKLSSILLTLAKACRQLASLVMQTMHSMVLPGWCSTSKWTAMARFGYCGATQSDFRVCPRIRQSSPNQTLISRMKCRPNL